MGLQALSPQLGLRRTKPTQHPTQFAFRVLMPGRGAVDGYHLWCFFLQPRCPWLMQYEQRPCQQWVAGRRAQTDFSR